MIIKNLEVSEIVLTRVDYKNNLIQLNVRFSNDTPVTLDLNFENDFDLLISKIIKQVKLVKKPRDNDNDDFLSGVSIVNVVNEEEISGEEKKKFQKGYFH